MRKSMLLLVLLMSVVPVFAVESPQILHFKNNVTYDHEGHKGECISCHGTVAGGSKIPGFGREWAHKVCIECHTTMGSGPTKCAECHKPK